VIRAPSNKININNKREQFSLPGNVANWSRSVRHKKQQNYYVQTVALRRIAAVLSVRHVKC